MPMTAPTMATFLKTTLFGCQGGGISIMWNAICDYVELNAMVNCAWAAATPTVPPVTDPLLTAVGFINTAGGRVLDTTGLDAITDPTAALTFLGTKMSLAAMRWTVSLPEALGFFVTPGVMVTPPPIILAPPSMATDGYLALLDISTKFIMGLNSPTVVFTPSAGTHLTFVGVGTYTPGIF